MHLCDRCNKSFKYKSNLRRHLQLHSDPKVRCECGEEFNSNEKLNEHKKKHLDDKPYKCNECNHVFASKSGLWGPKRLIHKKTIKCTVCDKVFGQKGHLKEHMVTHSDDKPFSCQLCKKKFKFKRNATRHTKQCVQPNVATPDVHKCSLCPNSVFKAKRYLAEHQKVKHSSKTEHQCPTCGSMFKWRASLSRHVVKGRCPQKRNTD